LGTTDEAGNVASGSVRIDQSNNNLIHADGVRISVHGIDDLLIVANGKEVMIMPRGTSQNVRRFAKD